MMRKISIKFIFAKHSIFPIAYIDGADIILRSFFDLNCER